MKPERPVFVPLKVCKLKQQEFRLGFTRFSITIANKLVILHLIYNFNIFGKYIQNCRHNVFSYLKQFTGFISTIVGVRQQPGRPGFNPRSSHTKDSKKW